MHIFFISDAVVCVEQCTVGLPSEMAKHAQCTYDMNCGLSLFSQNSLKRRSLRSAGGKCEKKISPQVNTLYFILIILYNQNRIATPHKLYGNKCMKSGFNRMIVQI